MNHKEEPGRYILEMNIYSNDFDFLSSIEKAKSFAENEITSLKETIASIESLKPDCDKLDYTLAASSGALSVIIDIFLVGKPGESPVGEITDKWFENRTKDFAELCGWKDNGSSSSAINFLERKFKIPYDQRGAGDSGSVIFNLTPTNHHFKSLGHNPTLLGLFFSILNQFTNQSHFISEGELLGLQDADENFELLGNSVSSKLFCGFVNWIGHLISDISGSSGSKGRGMGIPSPFWAWTNDIIAVRRTLKIPVSEFDKTINELAVSIYNKGFDIRFQSAQVIPVLINELIVRLFYAIRRLMQYISITEKEEQSVSAMWQACEPFSNPTIKRMLTVAHGTFCMVDLSDATIRSFMTGGGYFNVTEFFLRLNIIGIGRLTISLYGEGKRAISVHTARSEGQFARREITIVEDYLSGLSILSELYDDKYLIDFVDDFKESGMYLQAFEKSARFAEVRMVPEEKIVKTKSDIDLYFGGINYE